MYHYSSDCIVYYYSNNYGVTQAAVEVEIELVHHYRLQSFLGENTSVGV